MQPHEKAKQDRVTAFADVVEREIENTAVEAYRTIPPTGTGSAVISALVLALANAIMFEALLTKACPHKAFMYANMVLASYVSMDGVVMAERPLFIELQRLVDANPADEPLH